LYTGGPENRKSLTIIEAISAAGQHFLAFVIAPGKEIMEAWINNSLSGADVVTLIDTGYINYDVIMQWLDYFIEQIGVGSTQPWNLLLCNGYVTHKYKPFTVKAAEHHILVILYPSHKTHALQPLNVKCF
jgi:hypothetical protein